jgi:hypothetical protein
LQALREGLNPINPINYLCSRMAQLKTSPYLMYSDGKGNIFEDKTLYTPGRSGWDAIPIPVEEWIELPEGGSLYELPGRKGIGIDVKSGEMRLCEKGWAVAAFIPPAHTGLYLAATLPPAGTMKRFMCLRLGLNRTSGRIAKATIGKSSMTA